MNENNFNLNKWINEYSDGETECKYCRYGDECSGAVRCYGGEPLFSPCADVNLEELLDEEAIIEDYCNEN